MRFVLIPPGTFIMGASDNDRRIAFARTQDSAGLIKLQRYDDEAPAHRITITRPFFLGQFEVTQTQWRAVMHANPSSDYRCGGSCPVENVSWNDAAQFVNELNRADTEHEYRLPTEAEWEYAARAGGGPLVSGDQDARGWFGDNSGDRKIDAARVWRSDPDEYGRVVGSLHMRIHPVGRKEPNAFGLFDMFGNVWEWIADWYDPNYYAQSPKSDPKGPGTGAERVLRGGAFNHNSLINAPVTRVKFRPNGSATSFGLRVAAIRRRFSR
jgi:formylglycine-generating enzyme required for sulfatase activity